MNLQALGYPADEDDGVTFLFHQDLTVGDVVGPAILQCSPDTPLRQAAQLMQEAGCSSIVISVDGQPVGIWTERDALAVDFTDLAACERPIGEVMSQPIVTLPADTPLRSAAGHLRRQRLRHLLVVDDAGQPVGVLSQTDIVTNQGIEHYLHLKPVASVARQDVPRLPPATELTAAAAAMQTAQTDAVLVAYEDGSYGIITERDLVRLIAQPSHRPPLAGAVASRPLLTVPDDTSLYRVRTLLLESGIRHIGVTRDGELSGLLSFTDILSGLELAYVRELQSALEVRDRALAASRRSLRLAERIIESSLEGIFITDPNARILTVNPAFTRLTGYTESEVVGRTPAMLSSGRHGPEFYRAMWQQLNEQGQWQGEIWNRRKNGEVYPQYLSITAITDEAGNVTHYAGVFNDISKLKESEECIRNLAYYDPLTGLPNRRLLEDRLTMAIAHANRHGTRMAVLFIDLDRFKQINDSLGHHAGDQVLEQFAQRLKACVREDDTVARLGGDEFVVILAEVDGTADARAAAKRLLEALRAPVEAGGQHFVVTCSIGFCVYPDDGGTRDTLLQQADAAMYRAKQAGRDMYCGYRPEMNQSASERLSLETQLRQALERGQLKLYYQPLVDGEGRLRGAEALLRWQHPERGLLTPSAFVPLAEESGLILPIGDWVLEQALTQLRLWDARGLHLPELSINVSGRQFQHRRLVRSVATALQRSGPTVPSRLVLELTETVLMDTAMQSLKALKDLGPRLALDDFGTGYCSLIYLKKFPIDRIKIDRSFVHDMLESPPDCAIVATVIDLAHKLSLEVVAEGVDSRHLFEALRTHGCNLLQGYHFAPPLPAEEFAQRYLAPPS